MIVSIVITKKHNLVSTFIFFTPFLLSVNSFKNMGLAADDFWRLPWVNSLKINQLIPAAIDWIPGRNLQIFWVKISTTLFGIENEDIWKYHLLGLALLGFIGLLFFRILILMKIESNIALLSSMLLIFWPTHSETTFWIEQTIQVQLPIIFLLLWLIINIKFYDKKINFHNFLIIDFTLVFFILFTYDQVAFLIFLLILIRTFIFIKINIYKKIIFYFLPILILNFWWLFLSLGSRNGGPELKSFDLLKFESFLGLWHHSFEINSRLVSSRFQPYGLHGYWPWDFYGILIFIIFFIMIFFLFFYLYNLNVSYEIKDINLKLLKYLNLIFYLSVLFFTLTFILIAYRYYNINYFNNGFPNRRLFYVLFGILLFVLSNILIERNKFVTSFFYLKYRLLLLIIFFWSYFPVYLWSISPRHNFLPSLIICVFIAYLLSGIMHSKFNVTLRNLFAFVIVFFISMLAVNFHYSARGYAQSWLLKEDLYNNMLSSIDLESYNQKDSCWITKNSPQEFMGFPLFVYETPALGFNYYFKLDSVGECNPELEYKNQYTLEFDLEKEYRTKFNYVISKVKL